MSDEIKEFRISNEAIDDPAELSQRIADEGYLFFKRLQNPDKLIGLRREMMTAIQRSGWLIAGTDPMDGIADISAQCTEGDNEYSLGYAEVYKLEAFHRSGHWPDVTDMAEKIMGRPVMPFPQKIARIWFPQYTEHTTPTHQDFVHFQGNFDTLTCWTPVGDCPLELGGLAVIPGSHKVNRVLEHHFSLGAGQLVVDPKEHADELEPVWYSTDYEIGDTLLFPALTIHRALPNTTEDKLRLSLDNRYHPVGNPISERMLEPHGPSQLHWDEIYRSWTSDDFTYYWQRVDNPIVPFDTSYADKGFAEALELAHSGNEDALYRLRRTAKNDPNSEYGRTARAVLDERSAVG